MTSRHDPDVSASSLSGTTEPCNPEQSCLPSGYVGLIGRPNSGKSTLMNAMIGHDLAITTSKPQTTRNQILGVRTYPNKGQLCFLDTPGLHTSRRGLNRRMNRMAADTANQVETICHVLDAARYLRKGTLNLQQLRDDEAMVLRVLKPYVGSVPVNLILNKVDLIPKKDLLLPFIEETSKLLDYTEVVPLSALQSAHADRLADLLLSQLPARGFLFPEEMLTDRAERFIAAEFVRQSIIEQTHQEIPYSVAVEIERFEEQDHCITISAVIHLEKTTQKGILIGKQGARIKAIGVDSRGRLESFFGKQVYLETFVRVEEQWLDNPGALDRFGYGEGQ